MKHVLLIAVLLVVGLFSGGTQAQTGACPAGQFVRVVGSNIVSQACATPSAFSGTLPVANGGTGAASLTDHGVLLGSGTAAITPTAVGTTGQLLQGATGADPGWATTLSGAYVFNNALVTFGATTPTHVAFAQTTAPALTSCGTSPAIVGTDAAGTVTMGTDTPTGCVITFNAAYTAAPHCVVSWRATPLASQSYTVSTTAITLTQTATSSNLVDYTCIAVAGG